MITKIITEIMARNRIKVHPMGYNKAKLGKTIPYKVAHRGEPTTGKVQTIVIDKKNNIIKNIIHSAANKIRKGRTLAEMVYESFPV